MTDKQYDRCKNFGYAEFSKTESRPVEGEREREKLEGLLPTVFNMDISFLSILEKFIAAVAPMTGSISIRFALLPSST